MASFVAAVALGIFDVEVFLVVVAAMAFVNASLTAGANPPGRPPVAHVSRSRPRAHLLLGAVRHVPVPADRHLGAVQGDLAVPARRQGLAQVRAERLRPRVAVRRAQVSLSDSVVSGSEYGLRDSVRPAGRLDQECSERAAGSSRLRSLAWMQGRRDRAARCRRRRVAWRALHRRRSAQRQRALALELRAARRGRRPRGRRASPSA